MRRAALYIYISDWGGGGGADTDDDEDNSRGIMVFIRQTPRTIIADDESSPWKKQGRSGKSC